MRQPLILVIDGSRATRAMYADCLRHHGYAVAEAGDVEEGARLFDALVPDVVITELYDVPGSGDAPVRTPARGVAATIVCSTHIDARWPALPPGVQADLALPKPTSPRALLLEVQWLLARRRVAVPA